MRRLKAGDFVCKIGVFGENNFMKFRFCAIFTAAAFAVCVFFPSFSTAAEEVSVDSVNAAFGIKMFSEGGIWKDKPLDFARRLGYKFMGAKQGGKMLAYADDVKTPILGAKAEQFKFSFEGDSIDGVDIVFFNKGDSMGKNDSWNSSKVSQMRKDAKSISEKLSSVFGEPEKGRFGSGKLRSDVKVWKWRDCLFMLDFEEKEYIILRVRGSDFAVDGKGERADKKRDFKAGVKREENGDVYISGVPMVDQGDKGYCATATVERCLKYYGIENVDMHKIAELCGTGAGGGTTTNALLSGMKKVCSAYRLKIGDAKMAMGSIKKNIDDGMLVCWFLLSTDEYVVRMMENTKSRKGASADDWAKTLRKQKRLKSADPDSGHICLIIGYNEKTKEIGVSNSWGEKAALTWVRFDDAKTVNLGTFSLVPR